MTVDGVERARHMQELRLLRLGTPTSKGKFAIAVDHGFSLPQEVEAFEHLLDNEMIKLVDITTRLEAAPGVAMRVFRLTEEGWRRKRFLEIAYA
jgi:hypothetical protein